MALTYSVQAQVVDLSSDTPRPTDRFLVDTNIWLWMAYPPAASGARPYQITSYPTYLKAAKAAKSVIYHCGLSFSELGHNVEKAEREIFERANPTLRPTSSPKIGWMKTKEFRHNHSTARTKVVSEIQTACALVQTFGPTLDVHVDAGVITAALARLSTQPLDGYDLFFLEAMKAASVDKILTDDGDYCCVPGILVFTANSSVVSAAASQGKLLKR